MPYHDAGVTAQWECRWVTLPDNDLTKETLQLAPSRVFGEQFRVKQVLGEASGVEANFPRRTIVEAEVSKLLYTIMVRFQEGSEAIGAEPPAWALVEETAINNETGTAIPIGEVFPII